MKAAFYLGTHGTEPERTVRALMDNRGWMLEHGIEPIPPSRHRGLLEEALAALSGGALVAASACTRFGVFEAGLESAKDPRYTIEPQKRRLAARRAAGNTGDSITG